MKRLLALVLALLPIALLAGACDDSGGYYGRGYAQAPSHVACGQFASCGTCTPQLGCGWCFTTSAGLCVDDPGDCPSASTVGWTWETTGCRAPLDAGAIAVSDGGHAGADAGTGSDASADAPRGD